MVKRSLPLHIVLFPRPVLPRLLPLRQQSGLAAIMGLFFLVVFAVGILRPVKNALALEGLGAAEFYKVYLVSAAVIAFVPVYDALARRVPWRWLVPGVALFFALNLVAFRAAFQFQGAVLGLLFYAWFDLFSAVLVAQFFMTTQRYFHARDAKQAYPLVIAGGAVGASLGGLVTGLFAHAIGTANLLLVAAALIALFGLLLPLASRELEQPVERRAGVRRMDAPDQGSAAALLRDPHVRLIAASVLLTVLVKQLLDYQFNALSLEVYRTRDAVSAFQGAFNAATQWLPLVAVLALRPLMRRWGVGAAVLLLPASMLAATLALSAWWSLQAAIAARTADTALRYSAERTGREVMYIPLPDEVKLRAKSYIDLAVENGVGKVLSAGLIFVLLRVMDARYLAHVSLALSAVWLAVALLLRQEYLRALARSIEGRFASLRGTFASLTDASTRSAVQRALRGGDALHAAFALDLLDQAEPGDARRFGAELVDLLDSPSEEIRLRALALLGRVPGDVEEARVRERLRDPAPAVRQAAVRVLCLHHPERRDDLLRELLRSPEPPVRSAALASLALGEVGVDGARLVHGDFLRQRQEAARRGDADARVELALAAGAMRGDDPEAARLLRPLLDDADPRVAAAALRSAGFLRWPEFHPKLISALGHRATREAAREALVRHGVDAVPALAARLLDPAADPPVRRSIPAVLARIPAPATVRALLHSYAAPETDQLLDHRTLKALNKLRAHHPELAFDARLVLRAVDSEVDAARRYADARGVLDGLGASGSGVDLLRRSLREGWRERREGVFRCLGLLHPPREMYRCYLAVAGPSAARRANGLEWLEQTLGRPLFLRLAPVLEPAPPRPAEPAALLRELLADGDTWIARCAQRAIQELHMAAAPAPAALSADGQAVLAGGRGGAAALIRPVLSPHPAPDAMDLIEKVFLLQQIDLLQEARSAHLALLASIAEELEARPGAVLFGRGEPTDALYVVVRGVVELRGPGGPLMVASEGMSFGSWALMDEAVSPADAHVVRAAQLLRITRDDFQDLLADHPELAIGMLQGLARRVRTLVA